MRIGLEVTSGIGSMATISVHEICDMCVKSGEKKDSFWWLEDLLSPSLVGSCILKATDVCKASTLPT